MGIVISILYQRELEFNPNGFSAIMPMDRSVTGQLSMLKFNYYISSIGINAHFTILALLRYRHFSQKERVLKGAAYSSKLLFQDIYQTCSSGVTHE